MRHKIDTSNSSDRGGRVHRNYSRRKKFTMKIEYDKQADALYIWMTQKKQRVVETVECYSGVTVDIGKNKKVIGVEILDFAKRVQRPRAKALSFELPNRTALPVY